MFQIPSSTATNAEAVYQEITSVITAVTDGESDLIANLANTASVLYHMMPEVNWAGFYLMRNGELVLGPFHGKPACIRIALGRGVSGTSADTGETIVVGNVHEFPGHIACDAASASEIVVPMITSHGCIGVMDIDSPVLNRFNEVDRLYLERIVALLMSRCTP